MRASASTVWRLRLCAYFARDDVPWTDDVSPAGDLGTATHSIIESRVSGRPLGALPDGVDRLRAQRLGDVYLEWFAGHRGDRQWLSEVSFAYDLQTGKSRVLGVGLNRQYGKIGPNEIAMTADLATEDGEVEIRDVKTGRPENEDAAEVNTQLATIGLAWRGVTGAEQIRVALDFVHPFGVSPDEHVFDAFDLDAWAESLRAYAAKVPTSKPEPGSHCKFCPAVSACPATTGALARVSPSEAIDSERRRLPIAMSVDAIENEEHARHQYLTLRAAKAAIDRAWGAVRGYVDAHGPIDLGGGRSYGSRESKRETIDLGDPAAVAVLRRELGAAFDLAVEYGTSKTAIKEAGRTIAPTTGENLAQIERRVLAALRDVGATKTTKSLTYDEIEIRKVLT
jgi:hypothetical protein